MKKFLALALALALCLTMVCGVASAESAFVSWYTFGDVYLTSVRTALNAALTAQGLDVTDKDSNANQQTQTDDINTALVTGANAIVINMVESGAIGTAETLMNTVAAYGVPAVFFNRAVSTDDAEAANLFKSYEKSAFIGTKFDEAGKMQGDMIGAYVLENYDAIDLNKDGVISYVMFKGDEANQEAILRTQYGVENADAKLTAAGKPQLAYYDANATTKYHVDMNGTWSNTASFEYMSTILAQYNDANGNMIELVICNNDGMAEGVIASLQEKGYNKEGAHVVPVFGVDATDNAKALIADGAMTGTVKQDADGMAAAIAQTAKAINEGKTAVDALGALSDARFSIAGDSKAKLFVAYAPYTGE